MNSNERATSSRLRKIKIVSRTFRILIKICVIFMALVGSLGALQTFIVCLGGKCIPFMNITMSIDFGSNQHYTMPTTFAAAVNGPMISWLEILLLACELSLIAWGVIALNRLFLLFERGVFFAAGNVRSVKTLSLVIFCLGVLQTTTSLLSSQKNIECSLLMLGALILFISWIMDEGRKIQEEQELTV